MTGFTPPVLVPRNEDAIARARERIAPRPIVFAVGDRIRVVAGLWAGCDGTVVGTNGSHVSPVLSVELVASGRTVPATLGVPLVERA